MTVSRWRKRNPRFSLRCLLLSPAMSSNAGMAKQTDGRRMALSLMSPPTALWLVGWLVGWLAGWLVGWLVVVCSLSLDS
jgi:hypothetical protein